MPTTGKLCLPIALAVLLAPAVVQAQTAAQPMVVVLKSWGVIRGDVSHVAEGIQVTSERGSVAVLRFEQVACLAQSLDDAYVQLAPSVDFRDANSFSPLFDWCLRHGLTERAREIMAQTQTAPLEPSRRQLMQRRLEEAIVTAQIERNQAWPSEVEKPSHSAELSAAQVDEAINRLPPHAEAFFNQQLHSKMVIGCTAAKCHSGESLALPMRHHGKGMVTPRGLTRHNLYQFLQYIDRESPGRSPILEMARTAHANQTEATFQTNDVGYLLLQQWVYAVSDHPEKYLTEVIQQQPPTDAVTSTQPTPGVVAPVGFVETSKPPEIPPQANSQPERPTAAAVPCDPAEFNQRHHPVKPK